MYVALLTCIPLSPHLQWRLHYLACQLVRVKSLLISYAQLIYCTPMGQQVLHRRSCPLVHTLYWVLLSTLHNNLNAGPSCHTLCNGEGAWK